MSSNLYSMRDEKNNSSFQDVRNNFYALDLALIGTISKLYTDDHYVDVTLATLGKDNNPITIKGVELLTLGTKAVDVSLAPSIGDTVILFAFKYYVEQLIADAEPIQRENFLPYGKANLKALLVCTNPKTSADATDKPIHVSVDADGNVTIINSGATSVQSDGTYSLQAKDAVTITSSDKGITIKGKSNVVINDHLTIKA